MTSGRWDEKFYLQRYGLNYEHYMRFGFREGFVPNAEQEALCCKSHLDRGWYLAINGDVAASGMDPGEHYHNYGIRELRCPNPSVFQSNAKALSSLPLTIVSVLHEHITVQSSSSMMTIEIPWECDWYASQLGINKEHCKQLWGKDQFEMILVRHFVNIGVFSGLSPHCKWDFDFNNDFYQQEYGKLLNDNTSTHVSIANASSTHVSAAQTSLLLQYYPLFHYAIAGRRLGYAPNIYSKNVIRRQYETPVAAIFSMGSKGYKIDTKWYLSSSSSSSPFPSSSSSSPSSSPSPSSSSSCNLCDVWNACNTNSDLFRHFIHHGYLHKFPNAEAQQFVKNMQSTCARNNALNRIQPLLKYCPRLLTTSSASSSASSSSSGIQTHVEKPAGRQSVKTQFFISMSTYRRRNGTTFASISQTIQKLLAQTYTNWKLYLVGDHYEDDEEFEKIVRLLPPHKVRAHNMPFAWERDNPDKADSTTTSLWFVAGCGAINTSLDLIEQDATGDSSEVIVHLDDDDLWTNNHLQVLAETYAQFPQAVCVFTRGTYPGNSLIPTISQTTTRLEPGNVVLRWKNVLHSALSYKHDCFGHLRYDPFGVEGDATMETKIRTIADSQGWQIICNPNITVYHENEKADYC